jgi:formamidopyrimidine-DNA glycosylase
MKTLDHLNVRFEFKGHGELYFFDTLSFGTLKATEDIKILEKKLKELGADILDDATTAEVFIKQLRKKTHATKAIGNVIVNQKVIAGIGNYLRADGLWMARISPFRKVADLTDSELEKIFKAIKILVLGDYNIHEGKKQGYIMADTRLPTYYKRDFFVYREKTDVDGNPVHKDELFEGSQKRYIFWCPKVQH